MEMPTIVCSYLEASSDSPVYVRLELNLTRCENSQIYNNLTWK